MKSTTTVLAVLGTLVLAAGCVRYHPLPARELRESRNEIATARQIGVQDDPEAARYLALARTQLNLALDLIDHGDNARAHYMLQRAALDGQLAIALAQENWMRSEAQQAVARVFAVREARGMGEAHASR